MWFRGAENELRSDWVTMARSFHVALVYVDVFTFNLVHFGLKLFSLVYYLYQPLLPTVMHQLMLYTIYPSANCIWQTSNAHHGPMHDMVSTLDEYRCYINELNNRTSTIICFIFFFIVFNCITRYIYIYWQWVLTISFLFFQDNYHNNTKSKIEYTIEYN